MFFFHSGIEILIKPENQTVLLGEQAVFFCQVKGDAGEIRLNGNTISDNPITWSPGVSVTFVALPIEQDELGINNITLRIMASVERNNSEVICTDHLLGITGGAHAYLTIQGKEPSFNGDLMLANNHATGGPAEPEVEYEVLQDEKQVLFSWPHPFTWKDYPITGYHIVCREMGSGKIIHDMTLTDTEGSVTNHTVTLPPDITDCHVLQCTVNATNSLGQSLPSISTISCKLL